MLPVSLSLYVYLSTLPLTFEMLTACFSQDFTGEHLTTLIKKLVEVDSKWVPTDPGTSLCASLHPLLFIYRALT